MMKEDLTQRRGGRKEKKEGRIYHGGKFGVTRRARSKRRRFENETDYRLGK